MPEKEKKESKKPERYTGGDIMETLTAGRIQKRLRIVIPEDLKEPPTPGPKKTTKKGKQE